MSASRRPIFAKQFCRRGHFWAIPDRTADGLECENCPAKVPFSWLMEQANPSAMAVRILESVAWRRPEDFPTFENNFKMALEHFRGTGDYSALPWSDLPDDLGGEQYTGGDRRLQ